MVDDVDEGEAKPQRALERDAANETDGFMREFKEMSNRMNELANAMFVDPFNNDFFEVFTRKRIELIRTIMNDEPESIRDLAKQVQRNVKNVFDDLQVLNECNIVTFEEDGKKRKPVVCKKTIILSFKMR